MTDIFVVGGGPAGMMAAGQAASAGAEVCLLEKMPDLGRKLLLTGQGRCNLTNNMDIRQFIVDCGPKARFLFGALNRFGNDQAIEFFQHRHLPVKLERGGRYFPESDRSLDVLLTLKRFLGETKVKILTNTRVIGLKKDNSGFTVCVHGSPSETRHPKTGHSEFHTSRLIIATGGKSYPATGSTGDGYQWAGAFGHAIVPPLPANVPMTVREQFVKRLQGLSLKNVRLTFRQDQSPKRHESLFGEMLFTHYGISGPIVLDASRTVGPWLVDGPVACSLDLKPALDFEVLDRRLQRDLAGHSRKDFGNLLKGLLPATLIPVFLELSGIDSTLKANQVTGEARKRTGQLLKNISFTVTGLRGFTEAVATAGGVALDEVNPATMESKIVPGLFFAGEVLDLDGPCGGYNLQIAWSTGYVSGVNAAAGRPQ